MRNDFAWDDTEYVLQNRAVRSFQNLHRFFGPSYWTQEMPTTIRSYRPLREASLTVDFALWGEQPAGYHLTSVLVHALVVLCVYALARDHLPGGRPTAVLAALVFALHPSRVEVVALVENRAELFAACLVLASLLCWTRSVRAEGLRRWSWFGCATAAFAVALASKVIAVALPLGLAAAACCLPACRGAGRRDGSDAAGPRVGSRMGGGFAVGSIVLLLALGAGFALWSMGIIEREAPFLARLSALPLVWRPALVLATFHSYLGMALLPVNSHADRLLGLPGPPLWAWYVGTCGWAVVLLIAVRRRRLCAGPAAFGVAWFLIFLLPVLNGVVIEGRPLAEQRLYLPLAGLCLCAGVGAAGRTAWRVCVLWAVVAYSALSCQQVFVWADNRALWLNNVANAPDNSRGRNNLGMQYAQSAAPALAARQLEAAWRLEPRDDATAANLALVHRQQGRLDLAAVWLERALRIKPDRAGLWRDLGEVQCMRQQWRQATHSLESAVAMAPKMVTAYDLLAAAHVALGQHARAEAVLKHALALEPNNSNLHAKMGLVYDRLGRPAQALRECHRAAELDPTSSAAFSTLAEVLLAAGLHTEAREACEHALRLDPQNPEARRLLHGMKDAGQPDKGKPGGAP